jgi:hypothetical protein
MEVNFDNLRKQIADEYNNIVSLMNRGALKDEQYIHDDNHCGSVIGDIIVSKKAISSHLNRLHDLIGTLAACHNDTDVQDISEDITLLTLKQ